MNNIKELTQTIAQGESKTVEFKTSFQKEVIESVVAFANAQGGKVFIEISRIKRLCKEHGIAEPKFQEMQKGFKVILYKEKLNEGINKGLNEGIKNLYAFIEKNPHLRVSQISQSLNIPAKTLERWIKQLKDENKIEFIGSKKTGGYIVK